MKIHKAKKVICGTVLTALALGVAAGYAAGQTACQAEAAEPAAEVQCITTIDFCREDIVAGDRLLPYYLQKVLIDSCDRYGVPYALALAVAEKESTFNPEAVSSTKDYGLMQINLCNHEWLKAQGLNPMTPAGNAEAGVLMLSNALAYYGDTEQALMVYNCGDAGAKQLWAKGVYSTSYSRDVMRLYDKWADVVGCL